MSIPTSKYFL